MGSRHERILLAITLWIPAIYQVLLHVLFHSALILTYLWDLKQNFYEKKTETNHQLAQTRKYQSMNTNPSQQAPRLVLFPLYYLLFTWSLLLYPSILRPTFARRADWTIGLQGILRIFLSKFSSLESCLSEAHSSIYMPYIYLIAKAAVPLGKVQLSLLPSLLIVRNWSGFPLNFIPWNLCSRNSQAQQLLSEVAALNCSSPKSLPCHPLLSLLAMRALSGKW